MSVGRGGRTGVRLLDIGEVIFIVYEFYVGRVLS